jgi:hypothetical protein
MFSPAPPERLPGGSFASRGDIIPIINFINELQL